jgi:hypothetical protein
MSEPIERVIDERTCVRDTRNDGNVNNRMLVKQFSRTCSDQC